MSLDEQNIMNKWKGIDDDAFAAVEALRGYAHGVQDLLADCVAALCDVDVKMMLTNTDVIHLAHARWLFWYSYRYMTNETLDKIALMTQRIGGESFTKQGVAASINKMSLLIEREDIWNRRWRIMKRIIKLRGQEDESVDNAIVIQVPKDLKGKINIAIKDK